MNENNDTLLLAQKTNEGFIDIPKNGILVVEGKISKKIKKHSNAGIWFTFPGFYSNTIIYTNPFTKTYAEEKYNVTDMPEVKMIPQITYRISDQEMFYKQICGRSVKEVRPDSRRLEGMFNDIKVSIRNIVVTCNFNQLENFSVRTIINGSGNEIYCQDNIPDETFETITQEFTNIERVYGVKIIKLGFADVTKPDIVQNAELEAKKAEEDKKAMIKIAEGKKEAAKAESEAITRIVKAYLDAGVPKEHIAKILMMEKMNGGTVIMGTGNNTEAMVAQLLQENQKGKQKTK